MTQNTKTICVYVVEEDEAIRTSLKRLLRASRLEVELFTSMSEFHNTPRRVQRDCILIDLRSMSLKEYARILKTGEANTLPPIIAVSDVDDESSRRKARELGARLLLHKPVDGHALLDAIHWLTDADNSDVKIH